MVPARPLRSLRNTSSFKVGHDVEVFVGGVQQHLILWKLVASWKSGKQLATYAKVAMHVNGVYMGKNGKELVRNEWWGLPNRKRMPTSSYGPGSPTTPKLVGLENGAFEIENASIPLFFSANVAKTF